jgi:hypothetical protein
MISRNGIYYNLSDSIHRLTVNDITFVFSSKSHLVKFKEKYRNHRITIAKSLSNRFSLTVFLNTVADVVLYSKIETRGFLLVINGGEEVCKENLILDGNKVTLND